jgi:hypothetical protein
MADVRHVTRDEIVKQLSELEGLYDMPTARFTMAFRNGHLDETPDFRRWAHLSAALDLFDRRLSRV